MEDKTLEEMTEEEFEAFLDRIGDAEFDRLTLPSFLDMLWALQSERAEEVIELTAHLAPDGVRMEAPPGVLVRGNEVFLDNKRLIIKWVGSPVPAT
jgi:hypothetical protein